MLGTKVIDRILAENGELVLISVDGPKDAANERISVRPPMLQVVRLASFQHAPSVPPYISLPRLSKIDGDDSGMSDKRKANEIAAGGGGVAGAMTRFPAERKRPIGTLVIVGVRDGVLWLIDSDEYSCKDKQSNFHSEPSEMSSRLPHKC